MTLTLQEALPAVDGAADATWKQAVAQAVNVIAHNQATFTTDDIWIYLEDNFSGVVTQDNRAMGPVMLRSVRDGICVLAKCSHCNTKKVMISSIRTEAHSMDIPVYESLVYGN